MKKKLAALVVLVGLGLAGLARAEDIVEILQELVFAPENVPSSVLTAAESTNLATPVRPKLTRRCPRVAISPSFSVANATACIEVVLYQRPPTTSANNYAGVALLQTITAASVGEAGSNLGRIPAYEGILTASTVGCQIYDVRLRSVSSGNVTWSSWTLGPETVRAKSTGE